jgi:O-antigen chain-terminating methyltransferase
MTERIPADEVAAARWVRDFVADNPAANLREARRALRNAGLDPGGRRFRRLWDWSHLEAVMRQVGTGSRHALHSEPGLRAAFDDRFRGSPTVIRERLEQYTKILDLGALEGVGRAIDLGCGRGEWLDVLAAHGIRGCGLDIDAGVAAVLRSHGHEVVVGDALEHLQTRPDGSLGLVTMFHLVEHLSFDRLLAVLREARRALGPGGVLLAETPNPRNLTVGAAAFYIDPTHQRPLPPELLQFLGEAAGFDAVRVLPLNPPAVPPFAVPAGLAGDPALEYVVAELNRWLLGPMDSALIASRATAR